MMQPLTVTGLLRLNDEDIYRLPEAERPAIKDFCDSKITCFNVSISHLAQNELNASYILKLNSDIKILKGIISKIDNLSQQ